MDLQVEECPIVRRSVQEQVCRNQGHLGELGSWPGCCFCKSPPGGAVARGFCCLHPQPLAQSQIRRETGSTLSMGPRVVRTTDVSDFPNRIPGPQKAATMSFTTDISEVLRPLSHRLLTLRWAAAVPPRREQPEGSWSGLAAAILKLT